MRNFIFTKWLTTKETFNSYGHYNEWLSKLPKEESKKTNLYHHEKYQYFLNNLQTEWD
ncbi:hypothetical protein CDLVIII_0860 [Clostridium sp. DL-VIII]|nr:hypothetical protein CDLVIII_0860 [Clostridium sp. DL-VIII]